MALVVVGACLVIPPLVALWPALVGMRFAAVVGSALIAATLVWSVALLVVAPSDDTGPLPWILLPFYVLIHTAFASVVAGIPWAIVREPRDGSSASGV